MFKSKEGDRLKYITQEGNISDELFSIAQRHEAIWNSQ